VSSKIASASRDGIVVFEDTFVEQSGNSSEVSGTDVKDQRDLLVKNGLEVVVEGGPFLVGEEGDVVGNNTLREGVQKRVRKSDMNSRDGGKVDHGRGNVAHNLSEYLESARLWLT